ncbi:aa3-type cytochrome oxidase subunit II [Actinomycetospora aeridis]|uniref:cytochrome-c oxidase n=1 Tax=Actinomycetospora aeridis TaxID=3129231 RepID=A0ABU8NBL0_9PSEU
MRRDGTPVRSRTGRARRAVGLAVAAVAVAVTTSGCSVDEVLRFGWPVGVTPEATQMRTLWTWAAVAALVVGVIVWGLTAWTVAFHRKKAGASDLPRQFQYNLPLELVLTVVPLVIVAVLFYFTVVVQNVVDRSATGDELQIEVVGFQWNWEFSYPETRAPNGEPASVVGTTTEVPLLVLPTDRPIAFTQRSQDVIHSFWVPEFLFKRDVMPNPEANDQKNTWVIDRIERPGAFVGRCAEFCGAYHSMMNFEVRALPPAQFDQFLRLRGQVDPQTGQGYTTAGALAAMNCGELCAPLSITTPPYDQSPTSQLAVK